MDTSQGPKGGRDGVSRNRAWYQPGRGDWPWPDRTCVALGIAASTRRKAILMSYALHSLQQSFTNYAWAAESFVFVYANCYA